MFDPQVLVLTLGAWVLGLLVGLVGALRHILRCPAARTITPPRQSPRPLPRALLWAPVSPGGRVLVRGICMICARPWGACPHTRNG